MTDLYSQQYWLGAEIELEWTDNLSSGIEQELRLKEAGSEFRETLSELFLEYELSDHFKIKPRYRLTLTDGEIQNRYSGDLYFQFDAGDDYEITTRFRYQHENVQKEDDFSDKLRTAIELEYELHDLANPYAAIEFFYRLNKINDLRKFRYTLGISTEITNQLDLNIFYRKDTEFNIIDPDIRYILGLGLSYNIKLDE